MLKLIPHPQIKKIMNNRIVYYWKRTLPAGQRPSCLQIIRCACACECVCVCVCGSLVNERHDVKSFATCQRRSVALAATFSSSNQMNKALCLGQGVCVCVSVFSVLVECSSPSAYFLTISSLTATCLLLCLPNHPIKPFQISSSSCSSSLFAASVSGCPLNEQLSLQFLLLSSLSRPSFLPLLHLFCVFRCGVKRPCQITNTVKLRELFTFSDDLRPLFFGTPYLPWLSRMYNARDDKNNDALNTSVKCTAIQSKVTVLHYCCKYKQRFSVRQDLTHTHTHESTFICSESFAWYILHLGENLYCRTLNWNSPRGSKNTCSIRKSEKLVFFFPRRYKQMTSQGGPLCIELGWATLDGSLLVCQTDGGSRAMRAGFEERILCSRSLLFLSYF